MKFNSNFLYILSIIVLIQWNVPAKAQGRVLSREIKSILNAAGKNRSNLEGYLDHYKDSSDLKWKSACFIVENMDIHYSEVCHWVDEFNNLVPFNEQDYPTYSLSIKSFNELRNQKKIHPVVERIPDINCITSQFLIDNTEFAFKIWEKQKNRNYTFDEFCEYILPYRNFSEKLENWRDVYYNEFAPKNNNSFKMTVKKSSDCLNDLLKGYFVSSYSYESKEINTISLSPLQMIFRKRGLCEDMVSFTLFVFKSQGIPCRIDMVPFHGTSTGRHYWNVVIDEKHSALPFEGAQSFIDQFSLKREPSKVLTITYSKQKETLASKFPLSEIPAGFLRNRNYKDVTDLYWRTKDVKCKLFNKTKLKVAYISVLNGLTWCPCFWGEINNGCDVSFSKMGCGVIYLPMIYLGKKIIPSAYPIAVHLDGEQEILKINYQRLHNIKIEEQEKYLKFQQGKKYTLFYWDNAWKMLGMPKTANGDSMIFENVPSNSLLLLIPENSKRKERPFTISLSGERMWW